MNEGIIKECSCAPQIPQRGSFSIILSSYLSLFSMLLSYSFLLYREARERERERGGEGEGYYYKYIISLKEGRYKGLKK